MRGDFLLSAGWIFALRYVDCGVRGWLFLQGLGFLLPGCVGFFCGLWRWFIKKQKKTKTHKQSNEFN